MSRKFNPKNIELPNYNQKSINRKGKKSFNKIRKFETKIYKKKVSPFTLRNNIINFNTLNNTDNEDYNKNRIIESIGIEKSKKKDSMHKIFDSPNYKQLNITYGRNNKTNKKIRFSDNKISDNLDNLSSLYLSKGREILTSKNNKQNNNNPQNFKRVESSEIHYSNIYNNYKKMNNIIYHKANIKKFIEEEKNDKNHFFCNNNYFDTHNIDDISERNYNKNSFKSALKKGALSQSLLINKYKENDEHYETNPK